MDGIIKESTDGKYIGKICSIDPEFAYVVLPSNKKLIIYFKKDLGEGQWRLWNSNYNIVVQLERSLNDA